MSSTASPLARGPRGVTKSKVVGARLLPDERAELERIAISEERSTSSMMRLIFLRGLDHYRREHSTVS